MDNKVSNMKIRLAELELIFVRHTEEDIVASVTIINPNTGKVQKNWNKLKNLLMMDKEKQLKIVLLNKQNRDTIGDLIKASERKKE